MFWYPPFALEHAAGGKPHRGEWRCDPLRRGRPCSRRTAFHGMVCHHAGGEIAAEHWSCCGATSRFAPCTKPAGGTCSSSSSVGGGGGGGGGGGSVSSGGSSSTSGSICSGSSRPSGPHAHPLQHGKLRGGWTCAWCGHDFDGEEAGFGCLACRYCECETCFRRPSWSTMQLPTGYGHPCELEARPSPAGYRCNVCASRFPSGARTYKCVAHDWDECPACFAKTASREYVIYP